MENFINMHQKTLKDMESIKTSSPLSSLQVALDANLSLADLLQAHIAYICETTGAAQASVMRQIATQLHVDPRTIHNWVKGRHRPHDEMVQNLVDTLSKLASIPGDTENRLSIIEQQRKAIHSACIRPEKNIGIEQKTEETRDVGVFREKNSFVIHMKKKSVAMMAAAVFFGAVWAAKSTTDISGRDIPAGNQIFNSNVVLIGGFEEPALTAENPSLYFPKSRTWKTWGHNGGGIQRNKSGWGAPSAPEGVQTAFLQSGDVHMSTEIHIEPGTYNISFYAARRRYGQENPNPVQILINGKEKGQPFTPADTNFQRHASPDFIISKSDTYTIELATRSKQAEKGDTFVDKVELNLVAASPDPDVLKSPFDAVGSKIRHWWGR